MFHIDMRRWGEWDLHRGSRGCWRFLVLVVGGWVLFPMFDALSFCLGVGIMLQEFEVDDGLFSVW